MRIFHTVIALLFFSFCFQAIAFIPKGMVILQKTAENNGSGGYIIEQEVQFQTAPEPIVLKETWIVDNENSMRLTVTGTKELKDLFKMQFSYSGGVRTSLVGSTKQSKKLSDDFIERYFHIRNADSYANHLLQLKIANSSIFQKKIIRAAKDFDNSPEDFVRLSRTGGVVNYAFGTPAISESADSSPGFWIEQDQFVLRKFRLPSGVEVSAEKYSQYARGLNFPRKRSVRWDNNTVQIQTLSVAGKGPGSSGALEATRTESLDSLSNKNIILEFYNRYR